MATLVNKLNREVKVIIPNMREFSTFYSDNEGVLPMFFKKDWKPIKEEQWKPSKEQMEALEGEIRYCYACGIHDRGRELQSLHEQLQRQM